LEGGTKKPVEKELTDSQKSGFDLTGGEGERRNEKGKTLNPELLAGGEPARGLVEGLETGNR